MKSNNFKNIAFGMTKEIEPTRPIINKEYLRQRFDYEPATGQLLWRKWPDNKAHWNSRFQGKYAGFNSNFKNKYKVRAITLDGIFIRAGRLVWVWHNGSSKAGYAVVHLDGDWLNDRIENLKLKYFKSSAGSRWNG